MLYNTPQDAIEETDKNSWDMFFICAKSQA